MPTWAESDRKFSDLVEQWSQEIQEGDVVQTPSGDLRVVRDVHRHPKAFGKGASRATKARRVFCYFAIRHCSWTGAGYTLYSVAEMAQMGWLPTTVEPRKLDSEIDEKLKSDFGKDNKGRCMRCCDAVGLP